MFVLYQIQALVKDARHIFQYAAGTVYSVCVGGY